MTDDERQRRLAALREFQKLDHGATEPDMAFLLDEIDRLRNEYDALAAEVREWTQWPSNLKDHPGMYPHIDKALKEGRPVD